MSSGFSPPGRPASATVYVVAPDRLVGWIRAPSDAAKAFLPPRYAEVPVVGRLTGKADRTGPDLLKQLAPDLILDVGTVDAKYAALADRVQRDTGIPYLLLDGSLRRTSELLRTLGELLGVPERGTALAAWAERALAETGGRTATLAADQRRRAYFGRGAEGLDTGSNSINVESLDVAGLVNVAAELESGWPPGDAGAGGQVAARADRDRAARPAGQARRRSDLLEHGDRGRRRRRPRGARRPPFGSSRARPGPNRLLGLYWFAAVAYSGSSHADLDGRAREFYRLFYGVDLTPEGLQTLLGNGAP